MTTSGVSRKGKTRSRIELEVRHREQEAVRLRAANTSYEAIAQQLGWSNGTAARKAVQRVLDRHEEADVKTVRQIEQAKYDQVEAELLEIRRTRHTAHSMGRVVHTVEEHPDAEGNPVPTIVPVEDVMPRISAINSTIRVWERRSKLMGLDAPLRRIVDVYTEELGQRAIVELNAQLSEMERLEARQQVEQSRTRPV